MKIKSQILSLILIVSIMCGLFNSTNVVKANDDLPDKSTYSYNFQNRVLQDNAVYYEPSFTEE